MSVWLLLTLAYCTATAQTINTDAAMRYWQLTDALRQNQPLTDQAWDAFVNMPGNKTYIQNTFDAAGLRQYRQAIETVYTPAQDSLLQAKLQAKAEPYVTVYDYKQREAEFKRYLREAVQQPHYLTRMYALAYAYLPPQAHTKVPLLQLYYTALSDGATSQDEGIFFSLKAAVENNQPKPGILEAHEMHHQLLPTLPTMHFRAVAKQDQGLFWVLDVLRTEGVADLIDKTAQLAAPATPATLGAWLLDPAPRTIQRLDSTIAAAATAGAPASQPIRYYQQLIAGGGHQPGYYMARVIEQNGYIQPLIKELSNPIAFVLCYQKAARKDAHRPPTFSKVSIQYLKKLNKKYSRATT